MEPIHGWRSALRDPTRTEQVCKTLCERAGIGPCWHARHNGGGIVAASMEAPPQRAAWVLARVLWKPGDPGLPLGTVLDWLDSDLLAVVADLLDALAHSPGAVDDWITRHSVLPLGGAR